VPRFARRSPAELTELVRIANVDPLHKLTIGDKLLLWSYRVHCSGTAKLLPKFLQSVNWSSIAATREARRLLPLWEKYEKGTEVEVSERPNQARASHN